MSERDFLYAMSVGMAIGLLVGIALGLLVGHKASAPRRDRSPVRRVVYRRASCGRRW